MQFFQKLAVKIGEPIILAGYSDRGQSLIHAAKKTTQVVGEVVVVAAEFIDSIPVNGDAQPFD